ncbi:hypothetical protein [Gluconobacter sp. P5B12]|uniref:hypothetical protein n=1 Tax=unclassified Gluconobacter TaxID=2644261 RepID=UPI001C04F712|nr:hypothetical protein [Gluconobacter sp. P5B12]
MSQTLNARSAPYVQEMEQLREERLDFALSLNRDVFPVTFERTMEHVATLTSYLDQVGHAA